MCVRNDATAAEGRGRLHVGAVRGLGSVLFSSRRRNPPASLQSNVTAHLIICSELGGSAARAKHGQLAACGRVAGRIEALFGTSVGTWNEGAWAHVHTQSSAFVARPLSRSLTARLTQKRFTLEHGNVTTQRAYVLCQRIEPSAGAGADGCQHPNQLQLGELRGCADKAVARLSDAIGLTLAVTGCSGPSRMGCRRRWSVSTRLDPSTGMLWIARSRPEHLRLAEEWHGDTQHRPTHSRQSVAHQTCREPLAEGDFVCLWDHLYGDTTKVPAPRLVSVSRTHCPGL